MSLELDSDDGLDGGAPIWAAFGDLMAVLLGVFVLILVGVIGIQLHLETRLRDEIQQRTQAEQRRKALEQALAEKEELVTQLSNQILFLQETISEESSDEQIDKAG